MEAFVVEELVNVAPLVALSWPPIVEEAVVTKFVNICVAVKVFAVYVFAIVVEEWV